ncbi:MAG TPA: amylo-alpha-1,6-glucosidase [Hyphomicrobiaceae bacterium]|nr:amylo-alpha-1,6-glucosidase [Hyphomicrobiaceae bacterium]
MDIKGISPGHDPGIGEAPFYIPATGSPSRPRRTLKHDDTFAVFDNHGDIGASGGAPDGLFDRDTRLLSHFELLIDGAQSLLLRSAVKDDNLHYQVDLTNPDVYGDNQLILMKDTVHIARALYLFDGSLRQRLALVNYGSEPVELTMSLAFASDFADLFEVRGVRRKRRGRYLAGLVDAGTVTLSYMGLDGDVRQTALSFEPLPTSLGNNAASYALRLEPGAQQTIFTTVSGRGLRQSTRSFFTGLIKRTREYKSGSATVATVETSNPLVNDILCRSMGDLRMLTTATADGPYPYAGIPWYSTTFGRDGIITALEVLWLDPELAAGVLRRLARYQAREQDPRADASPGKILHEMRGGEMARLGEVPFSLYYGSVDATPLFLILAGSYAQRTGDYELIRELWPAIERALAWIDGPADPDGDGFVEYARAAETGLSNQGWKDSYDSVFHADGRLADGPIALVEVQGYVFLAKRMIAECARRLGQDARAAMLEEQAEALRARFEEAFWCDELGTYAIALDGSKAPCRVRTSNAGHVLFAGIARSDRARHVASCLLRPPFYSGWGIRTVAQGEARYNPMSYHNGSIWPHDSALIGLGLGQYGYRHCVGTIFHGLIEATSYMDDRRIPELFCGFRRRTGRGPTLYPAACSPQAWAAATPFLLVKSMLGLTFEPERRCIRLVRPRLPEFVGDVTVRNLSLGGASADFILHRHGARVALELLRIDPDLAVTLDAKSD